MRPRSGLGSRPNRPGRMASRWRVLGPWFCMFGILTLACGPELQPNPQTRPAVPAVASGSIGAGGQGTEFGAGLRDVYTLRSDPAADGRNPFRFGEVTRGALTPAPPVERSRGFGRRAIDTDTAPGSATRPPATTFLLTFIGFMESPDIDGRIVVLTDGDFVFHGREGDIIDGRYRIVGLGLESVDLEPIDGAGRQTLRLQGE